MQEIIFIIEKIKKYRKCPALLDIHQVSLIYCPCFSEGSLRRLFWESCLVTTHPVLRLFSITFQHYRDKVVRQFLEVLLATVQGVLLVLCTSEDESQRSVAK